MQQPPLSTRVEEICKPYDTLLGGFYALAEAYDSLAKKLEELETISPPPPESSCPEYPPFSPDDYEGRFENEENPVDVGHILDNQSSSLSLLSPASNDVLHEDDGITHINIYSKGATKLGKLLTNFAGTPFELDGIKFPSVETFWYFVKMRNANSTGTGEIFPESEIKSLLGKSGYQAKEYYTKFLKKAIKAPGPDKGELSRAYQAKLDSHPDLKEMLMQNTLPFAHYYLFGDKKVNSDEHLWTADLWREIRDIL